MAVDPATLNWIDGSSGRGAWQLEAGGGMIQPATIAGSAVPNYSPPGADTSGIWAISASVATGISGIAAPLKGRARQLMLMNVGSVAIPLLQNSGLSLAPNRILMADASHTVEPGQLVPLYYFPPLSKWVLGAPSASPAPPGPTDLCITRTVSADLTIAADTTCLQRRPIIAAGVSVTILSTGEWLIL